MVRLTLKLKFPFQETKFKKTMKLSVNPLDSKKIEFNQELKVSLRSLSNDDKIDFKKFEEMLMTAGETFKCNKIKHPLITILEKKLKTMSLMFSSISIKEERLKMQSTQKLIIILLMDRKLK